MKDSPAHLYRRFRYHVGPTPDPASSDRWATERLEGDELALFASMTVRDRVHSVAVARRVEAALAGLPVDGEQAGNLAHENAATAEWAVRAGLLHDVGKSLAPLGTTGRVVASLAEGSAAGDWLEARPHSRVVPVARMGAYLTYTELGAQRLEELGAHPMVSAWAREHHLPEDEWSVPQAVGRVLAEADGAA